MPVPFAQIPPSQDILLLDACAPELVPDGPVYDVDPPEMVFAGPIYGCAPCQNVLIAGGATLEGLRVRGRPAHVRCTGCGAISVARVTRVLRRDRRPGGGLPPR